MKAATLALAAMLATASHCLAQPAPAAPGLDPGVGAAPASSSGIPALQEYRTYIGAMPVCWRADQVRALLAAAEAGGEVHLSQHGCMGEPDAVFRLEERVAELEVTVAGVRYRAAIFRAVVAGVGTVFTFFSHRIE